MGMEVAANTVQLSAYKTCTKCGTSRLVGEFPQHTGRNHDAIGKQCTPCVSTARKKVWEIKNKRRLAALVIPKEKTCTNCYRTLSITEFSKSKGHKYGLRPDCKDCRGVKHLEWRGEQNSTPSKRKEYLDKKRAYSSSTGAYDKYFTKKFGLTYEEVRNIYDTQLGRCANRACGKEMNFYHEDKNGKASSNKACVDHDHITGKVRALLCLPCNTILGALETKGNTILGLLEYGYKHSPSNSKLFNISNLVQPIDGEVKWQ